MLVIYRVPLLILHLPLELLGNTREPLHAISPVLQLALGPVVPTPFPVIIETAPPTRQSTRGHESQKFPPKKLTRSFARNNTVRI